MGRAAGIRCRIGGELMPTAFQPDDVMSGLITTLAAALNAADIDTEDIGEAQIDDNDQLVLQMPCARPRYVESSYRALDTTATSYETQHIFEIWCAAENLTSKSAQRSATRQIVGQVIAALAGTRIPVEDKTGETSEPASIAAVGQMPEDVLGMIYIVRVTVPGIAQFTPPE